MPHEYPSGTKAVLRYMTKEFLLVEHLLSYITTPLNTVREILI